MGDLSSNPAGVLINCVTLQEPISSALVLPHQENKAVYSS